MEFVEHLECMESGKQARRLEPAIVCIMGMKVMNPLTLGETGTGE